MTMTAIDANATEDITFYLKWYTQDRVNLGRDHGVLMKKTLFVSIETVDGHAGLPGLHGAPGAALTNRYLNAPDFSGIQSIMGHNAQALLLAIQFEDTRA